MGNTRAKQVAVSVEFDRLNRDMAIPSAASPDDSMMAGTPVRVDRIAAVTGTGTPAVPPLAPLRQTLAETSLPPKCKPRPQPSTPLPELPEAQHATRRCVLTALPIVASDLLALTFCMLIARLAIAWHSPVGLGWGASLLTLPLILVYWQREVQPGIAVHPAAELRRLTLLNSVMFLPMATVTALTHSSAKWGLYFLATWACATILVPLGRAAARRLCARYDWWGQPVLVIGCGLPAYEAIRSLTRSRLSGLRPCGIVDPTGKSRGEILGVPFVRKPSGTHTVTYAIIALGSLSEVRLSQVVEQYRTRIPRLLVLSGCSNLPTLWRDVCDIGMGVAGSEIHNGLLLPGPRMVKRAFDIVLSLTALVCVLPLLLVIAVAIKLTSKGPALFSHQRIGCDGRPFSIWKFRSMRSDSAEVLRRLLASDPNARLEWEANHKLQKDPRIAPLAGFLRRSSLDELPQLWNVLRGEMSLVGPRPIVEEEVIKDGAVYPLYMEAKPGITGLWQVSGRNNTTYDARVGLDNYYVRNWSVWLDLYILASTVRVLVRRNGAY